MPTRRKGPRDRRSAAPRTPAEAAPATEAASADDRPDGAAAPDTPVPGGPAAQSEGIAADLEPLADHGADAPGTPAPADALPAEEPTPAAEPAPAPGRAPRRNALFPLGVNHYPLDAETSGWDDWYAADPEADFAAFAEARLTLVRVFLSWKSLEPQVGQYADAAEDRLQELVEAARRHKLQLIVCFFADDRLAEMLDVPWGRKRDPHTDPYLLQRQTALIQRVVNRYRAEPAIFGWDLANEAFCTGFTSADDLAAWAETMRDAVREVDPDRPVLLSVDPETLFRHTGVDARAALGPSEIAVSHVTAPYRAYAAEGPLTSGPSTYLDSFLLRSASGGVPVLLDDVGVHSLDHSHAEESAAVRTALYSGLMNRAAGVLLRRWRDLDTERREPYFRDPFEVLVGVRDIDDEPKPVMSEVASFARVAARIDLRRYTLVQERTAVLLPAERFEPLPNLASLYDPRACLQAYIAAKEAHVPVTVVHEGDSLDPYSVIVVPSAFSLEDSTWERLSAWVQGGGSLLLSYGGGDAPDIVRELFGVEFLGDGGARATLSCRIAQPDVLGHLTSFDARLDVPSFALLGQAGATVVATDATGSPLLTLNQAGQGRAVLCAAPLERALAQGDPWAPPGAVTALLRTVYAAVASAAGCGAPVACDAPGVELGLFAGEGEDILVLLNHEPATVDVGLVFDRAVTAVADVRGGQPVVVGSTDLAVPLAANGALALRLSYG